VTYIFRLILTAKNRGIKQMKQLSSKTRKDLKYKMAEVLNDNIQMLSSSMQDILLDDLITAFESRFDVLSQAQLNLHCFLGMEVKVPNEKVLA
jgi:hypothetical protein